MCSCRVYMNNSYLLTQLYLIYMYCVYIYVYVYIYRFIYDFLY